ncbi:MAG: M23 family metallopeptidase [Deltaproteobacteria bacterium]|nr:MAG: M23 family metallopeptidase [Deltaproteobacteria bacterium]
MSDLKSGMRKIWIGLLKDGKEAVLFDQRFPFSKQARERKILIKINVAPKKLGMSDGPAILRVVARDYSWRQWWQGNSAYLEKQIMIDTQPPGANVLSRFHYVRQGGAGLVIYRLSEPCQNSGVYVEDDFFPGRAGYFKDDKIFLAFFALAIERVPETKIFLSAVDLAGNRTDASFRYRIKPKRFKRDTVAITDKYLNWKMPELKTEETQEAPLPLIEKFVLANSELRQANFDKVAELGNRSTNDFHWKGAFLRLPKSARTAGFGDYREYRYNGRVVDRQVHLGIDLASIAKSPVPAANHGKVIFTGVLGIFGNTVIIDHGFGLLSMYSHLSRVMVDQQQTVSKGEIIGHTGMTGLAGGDHLHFAMFIHNTFVDPVEWWDAAWIENNIMAKIKAVNSIWQ